MIQKRVMEEHAIILDYLPHGYALENTGGRTIPVAQAIGKTHLILLELVPKKGIFLKPTQEVYIGDGKRDEIHHINGKINLDRLTATARAELNIIIKELVVKNENKFLEFFNKSQPVSTRMHQLELLPGVGKKHMWELIEARDEQPFENFEDIKKRVKLMPDPENTIVKRILSELSGNEKYKIFVTN
jgi:putative nucleotide binding protein